MGRFRAVENKDSYFHLKARCFILYLAAVGGYRVCSPGKSISHPKKEGDIQCHVKFWQLWRFSQILDLLVMK